MLSRNDILEQGKNVDALLLEAMSLLARRREAFDRIYHSLQSSYTFQQAQNTTDVLTFNVPEGHDFEATRLVIYPEIRLVSTDPTTQGPDDKVFRPTGWFPDFLNIMGVGTAGADVGVDAVIDISYTTKGGKSHRFSNASFFAAQTFGGSVNRSSGSTGNGFFIGGGPYNRFETPGGMIFNPFFLLDAGSAMTVHVTPLYSGATADGRLNEYRIRGVLEGYKRVRR